LRGVRLGFRLLQILKTKLQLIGIELFGAAAKSMPLQLLDQALQLRDADRRFLQQLPQRCWIVGQ
jgi:hypothetical protein